MKTPAVHLSPSTRIKHRIMQLNAQKEEQELRLKRDVEEAIQSFTPSNIIRSTVQNLKSDPEFRKDAIKQGISMGTGFLLDAIVFRNGFGLKSSLVSAGLKKAISYFLNKRKANT